jgi:hypothetical protein
MVTIEVSFLEFKKLSFYYISIEYAMLI